MLHLHEDLAKEQREIDKSHPQFPSCLATYTTLVKIYEYKLQLRAIAIIYAIIRHSSAAAAKANDNMQANCQKHGQTGNNQERRQQTANEQQQQQQKHKDRQTTTN